MNSLLVLHEAAVNNWCHVLKELVQDTQSNHQESDDHGCTMGAVGVPVNAIESMHGFTPILVAARSGQVEVCISPTGQLGF
jgi:hypothetical protein